MGTISCPSCGLANPAGASACSKCSAVLPDKPKRFDWTAMTLAAVMTVTLCFLAWWIVSAAARPKDGFEDDEWALTMALRIVDGDPVILWLAVAAFFGGLVPVAFKHSTGTLLDGGRGAAVGGLVFLGAIAANHHDELAKRELFTNALIAAIFVALSVMFAAGLVGGLVGERIRRGRP